MNATDDLLLNKISDMSLTENAALNIRKNGELLTRKITDDVEIVSKEDGTGIDINVKENAKNAFVLIPVIITQGDLNDKVYNDFHIGKNAKVIIMAGCGINNPDKKDSSHQGIHRFFLAENADVKYIEKHYGTGKGNGHRFLDPITEIYLKEGSIMDIDTVQIEGVDKTVRITKAELDSNTTLTINEKIMTNDSQFGQTEFEIDLNGVNSSTHVTSRAVAIGNSRQAFISKVRGNNNCYAHIECDAIIKDNANIKAIPEIIANHVDARLVHEATIGKIAGEQLTKLMTLGLSAEDAENEIIKGFLK